MIKELSGATFFIPGHQKGESKKKSNFFLKNISSLFDWRCPLAITHKFTRRGAVVYSSSLCEVFLRPRGVLESCDTRSSDALYTRTRPRKRGSAGKEEEEEEEEEEKRGG